VLCLTPGTQADVAGALAPLVAELDALLEPLPESHVNSPALASCCSIAG
jgi:hypothetical protein